MRPSSAQPLNGTKKRQRQKPLLRLLECVLPDGTLAQPMAQDLAQEIAKNGRRENTLAQPLRVLACPYRNAFNPYTQLLYDHLRASDPSLRVDGFRIWRAVLKRYDIVHIHWPEYHLSHWKTLFGRLSISMLMLAGMAWLKLRGAKLVWTAHNLSGHERESSPLAAAYRRVFQRMVSGVIFLTRSSRQNFLAAAKPASSATQADHAVIPHGHYKDVLTRPTRPTRGAGTQTLLYFGQIRPYKNVETLVQAFAEAGVPGWRLVVAGKPTDPDLTDRVRELARGCGNIHLQLEFVEQRELERLVAGADLVVLPYKRILNSGAVLYALSLGRPVLGPRQGSLPEIQEHVGSEWLQLYDDELDAHTLATHLRQHAPQHPADHPPLAWADWSTIAADTRGFYLQLLEAAG